MQISHLVIGAGALGAAAAYRLAAGGAKRVVVLEQHELVHLLGSSGDHSRIIRASYHRPEYVRMAADMFASWREIEARSGLPIFFRVGELDLAPAGIEGGARELEVYRRSLDGTPFQAEELDAAGIRARWPQWRIDDGTTGFFQADAGFVDIRRAVSAHTALALAAGVEFRTRTRATGIEAREGGVRVTTSDGVVEAESLVIAAASWAGELYESLGAAIPLALSEEQVSYFAGPRLGDFAPERFPVWVWHGEELLYGFPVHGDAGVKLARDMGGRRIRSEDRTHVGDEAGAEPLRAFLREHLPGAAGPTLKSLRCVYDMAPDRELILDRVPGHPNIVAVNGAGHAGKFAALIGELVAELLLDGTPRHDLSAFSLARPAIADPTFEPVYRLDDAR